MSKMEMSAATPVFKNDWFNRIFMKKSQYKALKMW